MPGWKRIVTILLVVLGPGGIIYFLAKNLENKFVELPYLGGYTYRYDSQNAVVDSVRFSLPDFELTRFDGTVINRDSIRDKFLVITTLQPMCPQLDECGMSLYLFDQIFFKKLIKNKDNYHNVVVLSVMTDKSGREVQAGPSQKLREEMAAYDTDHWWMTYGDPTPLFSFPYYGDRFMNHASDGRSGEIGPYAFVNSLVLVDREGHIRGVSGAKKDSDIRNLFDLLKILKKEEFDQNWEATHS